MLPYPSIHRYVATGVNQKNKSIYSPWNVALPTVNIPKLSRFKAVFVNRIYSCASYVTETCHLASRRNTRFVFAIVVVVLIIMHYYPFHYHIIII